MRTLASSLLGFCLLCLPLSAPSASLGLKKQTNHKETEQTQRAEISRKETSLNGEWRFRRDDKKDWKTVTLPTHWETHEGLKFDGIGWYEKEIELSPLPENRRLLLHFDAVATQATVYWNDVRLGEHLGGWTPFRFEVTNALPLSKGESEGVNAKRKHVIRIRVDEKVGHNTQGFLPIIQPHFGGIWQGVKLIEVPWTYLDDLKVNLSLDTSKKEFHVELPIIGPKKTTTSATIQISQLQSGMLSESAPQQTQVEKKQDELKRWNEVTHDWESMKRELESMKKEIEAKVGSSKIYQESSMLTIDSAENLVKGDSIRLTIPTHVHVLEDWSPTKPALYRIKFGVFGDEVTITTAHRTIETRGDQFLLNGQPLSIRGVLNWGYYPPSLSPNPSEEVWRNDLKLIKSWGFNLMKCCLWVPPKRLLEIADEEGVLIWLEYPTWHPQLTPKYEAELLREYKEFHQHDRNHPSVILRSLTCETGPGADLEVIKKLYNQCKQMCGGLVVDDSSWIEWNRVCDFYDDHPYGNNHTWVKTLTRLKDYIKTSKLGVKPLCLGEAIAADTWVPTQPMLDAIAKAKADPKQAWSLDERGYPYWVPGFFDTNQAWLKRMEKVCGSMIDERQLELDSLRYAELMRKYQIEAFRREIPHGGYVISVLRDFPLASMGLVDYSGNPKVLESNKWRFQRNTMSLLSLQQDRRSFASKGILPLEFVVSNFSSKTIKDFEFDALISYSPVEMLIVLPDGHFGIKVPSISIAGSATVNHQFKLPEVKDPTKLWVKSNDSRRDDPQQLQKLLQEGEKPIVNWWNLWVFPQPVTKNPSKVITRTILDLVTLNELEQGASVLLIPNGKAGSIPIRSHWFLRGAPFVNRSHSLFKHDKPLAANNISDLMVELQHFDLASDVIPDINYLEEIDPILMLWDNHDLKEVRTHGLVFETRMGKGRLLVSALNHHGETNAAGKWLLNVFLKHLDSGPPPRNALKPETIARMRAKLNEKKLDLTAKSWQFSPDGKNQGLELGWQKPEFDDSSWKPIKIGRHWENQGYSALDGWAWYRLKLDIPKDWSDSPFYLNTEGVDDAYEIYLNGVKIGEGGDIPNKKTAFEDRKAHHIPRLLWKNGEANVIAVRVNDWYGAGGIHRPMTISNVPIGGVDILK